MPVKSADWSFDGTETDPTNVQLRKPGGENITPAAWNTTGTGLVDPATGLDIAMLGSEVITVGTGGRFATVAEALAYIGTQGATITTYQATGSVALTQYSDWGVFTGGSPATEIQPNDFLYVPDDAQTLGYASHYYRVLGVFGEESGTEDAISLETGVCTFTGAILTPTFVRLKPYVILLLPGEHSLGTDAATRIVIPDGYNIAFVGIGPEVLLTGVPMETPAWGLISFKNLRTTSGTMCGYTKNQFPLLGANYPTVYLQDIRYGVTAINDPAGFADQEFLYGVFCPGLYVSNFQSEFTHDHGLVLNADNLQVDGFFSLIEETGFESLTIGVLLNRPAATKPKSIKNLDISRRNHAGTGTGAAGAVIMSISGYPDTSNTMRFNLSGVVVRDESTHGPVLQITGPASGALEVNVNNAVIDSVTYGTEINASGSAVAVNLNNVTRSNGNIARASATSSAVIKDHHPNATKSTAYAATVTPDASVSGTWVVGALTGNIIIAAPTNAATGQRLTMVFTQDGTGGRTITWNAVFKKAADGAGGASTKGSTSFMYDGTNWVQVGGALAWA